MAYRIDLYTSITSPYFIPPKHHLLLIGQQVFAKYLRILSHGTFKNQPENTALGKQIKLM